MQIAIIAGTGALPQAVSLALQGAPAFAPEGLQVEIPAEPFRFERLIPFLDGLVDRGITGVVLAGAMTRPRLDPAMFDPATAQMVPRLVAAMQGGDDATLRAVIAIIEEAGLQVHGLDEVAPDLLPAAGILGGHEPSGEDRRDMARAAQIVEALGRVDVGQGAVVAQGVCLGAETIVGTDVMLSQVARDAAGLRPDPKGAKGVLYKSSKPGQDRRVDLPALGPQTVRNAAAAGLAGIAFQAGSIVVLDRAEMIAEADRLGLFLWAV